MLKKFVTYIFLIFFSSLTLSSSVFCMQEDENHDKKHTSLKSRFWGITENIANPLVKSIGVVCVKEALDCIWEDPRIKLLSPALSTLLVSAAEQVIMKRNNFSSPLDKKIVLTAVKNMLLIESFYYFGNTLLAAGILPIIFLQEEIKSPYKRPFKTCEED